MHIVSPQPNETARPRVGQLDVLPVFLDLKGKRVFVAGGEEPAAWKAELLAAAGAVVEVYATDPCAELHALEARGVVRLAQGDWREADWNGLAMAVGDCAEEEAADFVAMARAHAVPVNVIDKPAHCQFQFGSIVNRSPLVVGISTNGAAPILGQAVRRRIEAILPANLSAWAGAAQRLRNKVMASLTPGAQRRAFWERLVDLSFSGRAPELAAEDLLADAAETPSGRVTLVGAGPGDAEHLTLKAMRALQSADVIVFDPHISTDVLELARREAARFPARETNEVDQLTALAEKGNHVVRLYEGDAARTGGVFSALDARQIPVSVVPGLAVHREPGEKRLRVAAG